jgi:aldehyde:ferredoxin oxidoreductase
MTLAIYGRKLELTDYRDGIRVFAGMNNLGIDLATAVGMMRFITRLYERGAITKKDTDNLDLHTGDIRAYLNLLEKMAEREGVGDAMAQGWYALSELLGVDARVDDDGDAIIKGTSALYDARFTALDPTRFECMVNPKGAMHNHSITYYPNQSIGAIKEFCRNLAMPQNIIERIVSNTDFNCGRFERHIEDGEAIYFSLGICVKHIMWEVLSLSLLADFYSAVTGIRMSPEELKVAGERIWNLYKHINAREGFTRDDDACPGLWAKTIDEPIKTSAGEIRLRDYYGRPLTHNDIEKMLDDYYDERGWDIRRGVPSAKKLKELGLL